MKDIHCELNGERYIVNIKGGWVNDWWLFSLVGDIGIERFI